MALLIGIRLESPVTIMEMIIVIGTRRGLNEMELEKTLMLTWLANTYPSTEPTVPPKKPSSILSPINSLMMLEFDAPIAFRRPISLRLSATTAVIVVATQIIVSASTTTVTSSTRACSFESTVVSEAVTRLTRLA